MRHAPALLLAFAALMAGCQGGAGQAYSGSDAETKEIVSEWVRHYANDPGSYEPVEWRIVEADTSSYDSPRKPWRIALHRFRTNYPLAGQRQEVKLYTIDADGEVINAQDFNVFVTEVAQDGAHSGGALNRKGRILRDLGMRSEKAGEEEADRLVTKWLAREG